MDTSLPAARPRGWPLFLAGFLLFLIGPAIYAYQYSNAHLTTPWHWPILSTLGVLFMAASLVRRMSILRTIGTVFFALFAGLLWFMFLHVAVNPPYEGPVKAGAALPAFTAKKADGATFSNSDLSAGKTTALVFFRGHW